MKTPARKRTGIYFILVILLQPTRLYALFDPLSELDFTALDFFTLSLTSLPWSSSLYPELLQFFVEFLDKFIKLRGSHFHLVYLPELLFCCGGDLLARRGRLFGNR